MDLQPHTSPKAVVAFFLGLLSFGSGVLALASASDIFLLGILVGCFLAILLGILARRDVRQSAGALHGNALAGWAIGLPVGGMVLGFLLLPMT